METILGISQITVMGPLLAHSLIFIIFRVYELKKTCINSFVYLLFILLSSSS